MTPQFLTGMSGELAPSQELEIRHAQNVGQLFSGLTLLREWFGSDTVARRAGIRVEDTAGTDVS